MGRGQRSSGACHHPSGSQTTHSSFGEVWQRLRGQATDVVQPGADTANIAPVINSTQVSGAQCGYVGLEFVGLAVAVCPACDLVGPQCPCACTHKAVHVGLVVIDTGSNPVGCHATLLAEAEVLRDLHGVHPQVFRVLVDQYRVGSASQLFRCQGAEVTQGVNAGHVISLLAQSVPFASNFVDLSDYIVSLYRIAVTESLGTQCVKSLDLRVTAERQYSLAVRPSLLLDFLHGRYLGRWCAAPRRGGHFWRRHRCSRGWSRSRTPTKPSRCGQAGVTREPLRVQPEATEDVRRGPWRRVFRQHGDELDRLLIRHLLGVRQCLR